MEHFRPIQGQDYGILRKKDSKDEELFVFGYACKVYEDYDKSLYVDQGKHLIPWLGDETLKIDRYDCRGALSDLTPYLPKSEGFDWRAGLNNEEKRIENLCDQERFRALTVNEEDEILYQEEELKRLQKALNSEKSYSEVAFNYDEGSKSSQDGNEKEMNEEEDDEPFIPPYQLDVPVGMKIPKNKKHHEIIERTAFFISDQGAQMEILLKMKQAENPQFNFLSFDNELHPYYRHMMTAIKNHRYKSTQVAPVEKESPKEPVQEDAYLHPSLVPNPTSFSLPESAPKIPNINYKPSQDCLYSALVNRIKESQGIRRDLSLDVIKKPGWTGLENPIYNPNLNDANSSDGTDEFKSNSMVPLSALTKSARRRRIRKEKTKAAAASFKLYYAEEDLKMPSEDAPSSDRTVNEESPTTDNDQPSEEAAILPPVPAPVPVVQVPPTDTQLIIDKMASYVAKNGRDFEDVVKAKGDPRFSFLDSQHMYNPYYNQKVELYLQLENPTLMQTLQPPDTRPVSKNVKAESELIPKKMNFKSIKSSKSAKAIPICFSIKKPTDQESLDVRNTFPYEESEKEDAEGSGEEAEKITDKNEEMDEKTSSPIDEPPSECPPKVEEPLTPKKATEMTLEKWAQDRLKAKLVTAAKEKLAAKDRDKQLQAERRKRAADFINLLHKDNLVNRTQTVETDTNSTSNGKKEVADVITIPSSSSSSDSDSIVSVPLSENEEKTKNLKRKHEDSSSKIKKRSDYPKERSKHRKSKHRSRSASQTSSSSYSRHVRKKYEKEKKSHGKKKKHHRHHSRSPIYHKKSHKSPRKSKRSRYPEDGFELLDSEDSSASFKRLP